MELENSTLLSIIVGIAGILAELIFHNVLSSSVFGMVLCIVLALVILCCAYFALDGISYSASAARKKEERRRREYDEKLYRLLNRRLSEQVKLEKAIFSRLAKGISIDRMPSGGQGIPFSAETLQELAGQIDRSTTKAAQMVARYGQKTQADTDKVLSDIREDILKSLDEIALEVRHLEDCLNSMSFSIENGTVPEGQGEEAPLFEENAPDMPLPTEEEDIPDMPLPAEEEDSSDMPLFAEGEDAPDMPLPAEEEDAPDMPLFAEENAPDMPLPAEEEDASDMPLPAEEEDSSDMPLFAEENAPDMSLFAEEEAAEGDGETQPSEELSDMPLPAEEGETVDILAGLDLSNPNKELSTDEIDALFAAAAGGTTETEDAEPERPEAAGLTETDLEESENIVPDSLSAEPDISTEPAIELPAEVEALLAEDSMVSPAQAEPERVSGVPSSQDAPEEEGMGAPPSLQDIPEEEEASVPEQAEEPKPELTALDILRMKQEEKERAAAVLQEEAPADSAQALAGGQQGAAAPGGDSNKNMSADDIAALIASMN